MTSAATSSSRRCRVTALGVALAVLMPACGKKGPPEPPLRVTPAAPGAAQARQIGTDVVLTASLHGKRTDGTPLGEGGGVQVLRMPASASLRPGAVSERYLVQTFLKQAKPVAEVTGDAFVSSVQQGSLRFVDRDAAVAPAAAGGVTAGPSLAYLYGLQVIEPGGKRSPLRPPLLVEIGTPPPAPGALQTEVVEGVVRLRWEPPATAASYNVYRRELASSREPDAPINAAPLAAPEYADRSFRYDIDYRYYVRSVDPRRATPCESVAGRPSDVRPHDSFAPAAPTGIAVAVEAGQIRVYWFPNAEADLSGYRIYRRAEGESEAHVVGEVASGESAFVDPSAAPGVRYHYSVSAVDGATPVNESRRSEERSDRLPATEPADSPAPGENGATR
jgi:hypothetical protein